MPGAHAATAPAAARELRRPTAILFWLAIAALAVLAVFVVPFAFPPPIPTFSTSYTYGFSNRAAQIAAVTLSAAVTLVLWSRRMGRTPPTPPASDAMPRAWLRNAILLTLLFVVILGGSFAHNNIFYSDATHIITQLNRVLNDHATLYRDVEFPYGPILFYWAAAIQWFFVSLGVSAPAAHMVTLAIMQTLGVAMAFYILQWLPLTRPLRKLALCLFTFGTLTPLLGINYTLLRFLLPHTLFLYTARRPSLRAQTALFALAQLFAVAFSPELGVALLGGVGCYALYRCFTERPAWLLTAVTPLLATFLYLALMRHGHLSAMGHFAIGEFNLVVVPEFHILILLTAAIALSPLAVAGFLQTRDTRAPILLGLYIISLGMLGPALGRCDPLHTFFGGLGLFALSLVAISGLRTKPAKLWAGALALSIVLYQLDNYRIYAPIVSHVLFVPPNANDGIDMNRVEALTHGQPVAVPVIIPERVHQELLRRHQFAPSYFVFLGGVWDDASERRKIAEMRHAPYALIPNYPWQVVHHGIDESRRERILRLGYRYHPRFQPWVQGALIEQELHDHWTPVGSAGPGNAFTIYRQNPS